MKLMKMRLRMTMWPAVMFANSRTVSANWLGEESDDFDGYHDNPERPVGPCGKMGCVALYAVGLE